MKQPKAWLTASGVFALVVLLAWAAGPLLGLEGRDLWILRGGLALLGLAGAVLAGMFVARRARRAPAPDAGEGDEVGEVLEAAQARLAASALAGSSRVSALPVVLVLGPAGSAKTSAVVHSGVDPELLAGEVERAGAVAPTGLLNAWYGRDTLFLEAGGALLDDEGRWQSLVRHLQPGRWGAVVGRGTQAPRAAVVCFACDELLRPGAADAVPAAARKLRGRLADLSRQLGVRLPVYVLFTRADRIPHFAEYVRGLTQEEAQEVLGATFPMADPRAAGLYPEFAGRRAGDALRTLARSLSVGQLHLLPREPREEARGAAYEFPRKLGKLSELATQFLVELCRPSQLHVSPFLRGFYFTGVRTVVATEGMEAPSAPVAGPHVALGATSVFDPRSLREAAAAPPPRGGTREVQEWAFARRIFSDVVLRDKVAMAATGGGTRVNALRRTLAAAAVVIALVAATGFTVSYGNNRGMLSGAVRAAREARKARVDPAELAGADALRRLDGLRGSAQTLAGYERNGRPLRLRWGLYTGGRAFPSLRRLYFQGFDRLLWTRARASLVGALRSLPEAPTGASEYGTTYDDLKAYLVTTSDSARSTGEFLAPVLERHWAPEGQADRERRELARRQFAFFGSELPHGNPFDPTVDEALVVNTRAFLGRFADVERFYNAMLVEAAKGARDVDFGREFPLAAPVAADPYVVPAAFTARGWGYVRGNARAVERLFAREDWVLGPHSVGAADRERIGRELHDRYVRAYVGHWRAFLEAGRVVPFGGLDDAARKLGPLSGNDSPVLQLLSLASQHTNVDSVLVAPIFQPVHTVVPPALRDRVAAEGTAAYLVALGGVRGALQQAAATPLALRSQPLSQAGMAVTQADGEVRKLAQSFRIDGDAGAVGAAVQRLLRAPVVGAQGVINPALASLPKPGEVTPPPPTGPGPNAAGAHFCAAFRALGSRYPFDPGAAGEAEVARVAAVLQPEQSALAELREAVAGLVTRQGRGYVARLGADPRPRGEFLAFFTTASDVSGALYGEGAGGPRVSFTLRPRTSAEVPEVSVTVDGRTRQFTRTLANSEAFTWHATDGGDAQLVARVGGAEVVVATGEGTWAAFRLFRGASWQPSGDGRWLAAWRVAGLSSPLVVEVRFADDVPVFNPAYLGRLTQCVQRIVP